MLSLIKKINILSEINKFDIKKKYQTWKNVIRINFIRGVLLLFHKK